MQIRHVARCNLMALNSLVRVFNFQLVRFTKYLHLFLGNINTNINLNTN